jgi:putative ABC transport system ATP-binding protein
MTTIIEIKDVWKTYKMGQIDVHALRGVSLEIKKGEFVAITGPSGSGKSTLMNMVGCLDTPSKGIVSLKGKDIAKLKESDLAQIRGKTIGFIFQQFNLLPSLTAKENVTLPLMFQNVSQEQREKSAKKFLELVGLEDRSHHTPNQLSGGQQQRVAIARALSGEPELILADEPTGNLDSKSGKAVMDFLMKRWKEEKTTLVIVTHDEKLAQLAPRRIYIKDGLIVKNLDEDTTKRL